MIIVNEVVIDLKSGTQPVNGLSKLKNHLGGNLPIHLYYVVPDINNILLIFVLRTMLQQEATNIKDGM
ncbi:unnamed protein product [Rhizophagus irregularis]|nr:unnamed protein product [Rhizophagus irregularis]